MEYATGKAVVSTMSAPYAAACMRLLPAPGENHTNSRKSKLEGGLALKLEKLPSPLNLRTFEAWLCRYLKVGDVEYSRLGFSGGF